MAPLELLVSLAAASVCVTDDACSLNGLCKAGACQCHAPWSGSSCGILDELPGPRMMPMTGPHQHHAGRASSRRQPQRPHLRIGTLIER
jgi:hypothetical protein